MYERAILSMALRKAAVRRSLSFGFAFQGISNAVVGHDHRFLETGVNQIQLVRAAYDGGLFPFGELSPGSQLDGPKQAMLHRLLVTLSHAAKTYVR